MARRLAAAIGFGTLVALADATAAAAQTSPQAEGPEGNSARREINVTGDSAPGWLPSIADEQQVLTASANYFRALDGEQYQTAYAMLAEINRTSQPITQFTDHNRQFHQKSGSLVQRRIVKITWTKDPAQAPFPGVYAAIDVAARFANVDRYCGYIVLYRKPAGGPFEVMREESNFIDNATADAIVHKQSQAVLDTAWARLSANCPNFATGAAPPR
jgi:hypothetical protein